MNKSFLAMLLAAGVVVAFQAVPVVAQEPDAAAVVAGTDAVPAMAAEEDKFSFGKVVSVVDMDITVKEYDFAKDADVDTVYTATTETEYGNIAALKDLVAGDDIVIDYLEKDGKKLITTLVKEEKGMEEAVMGEAAMAEGEAALDAEVPVAVPAQP